MPPAPEATTGSHGNRERAARSARTGADANGAAAPPRPTALADPQEVAALRARDPAVIELLVRRHSDRLYRFILHLVRDANTAQNLVQETFFQALRSLPSFKGHSQFSTWLFGIAKNVVMAHLRKARRWRVLSEAEMERLQPTFTPDGHHAETYAPWHPGAVLEQQERARLVHQAIDRLPEKYRVVVVLRDLEDLSTAEAAQVLGISEVNVRVRLHRARNTLRSLLAPHLTSKPGRASEA